MEFIKTAYCITIPLLLLLIWLGGSACKKYGTNLLTVTNVLLIGHSIFLIRQLFGAYQLATSFSVNYLHSFDNTGGMLWRLGLIIFLPFIYSSFFISLLALIGFPFLSGFYSKELIIEISFASYNINSFYIY